MSALLKGSAAAFAARPLVARTGAVLEIVSTEPSPSTESPELEALRAECGRLSEALAAAGHRADEAIAAALEQGRADARADDAKKLASLGEALGRASVVWRDRLASLDGLAAQLVGASVSKIFGDWDEGAELVIRAVRARLKILRREAVVAVQVSAADFPDQAALEATAEQVGSPGCRLLIDPDLSAGDCRIDLKLGAVDVAPRGQIAAIAALLEALAGREKA